MQKFLKVPADLFGLVQNDPEARINAFFSVKNTARFKDIESSARITALSVDRIG